MGKNPYKLAAQLKKANVLASTLIRYGVSASDAALMGAKEWNLLALAASVHPPSKETCDTALGILRDTEAAKAKPRKAKFPKF